MRLMLYDQLIRQVAQQLNQLPVSHLEVGATSWKQEASSGMIFKSDMAYELGGGSLPAVAGQLVTEDSDLVADNEICLCGPDLNQIPADTPYARIALIRLKPDYYKEEAQLYQGLRQIEYVRYHVHPYGYMNRISTTQHREPVRVSREAITQGLTFTEVGNSYLSQYLALPQVAAVKIIFLTVRDVNYEELLDLQLKAEQITGALDHMLKEFKMDCKTCQLKSVCDEVEGLREMHFGKQTE